MINKKLLIFIISMGIIITTCYGESLKYDFTGSWGFDGLADVGVGEPVQCTFTLTLKQRGNKLSGEYEAVALNGRRIDDDTENQISGTTAGNIANIEFKSASWGGYGKAKITHIGDGLIWEITKKATKGEFWCPQKAILKRSE